MNRIGSILLTIVVTGLVVGLSVALIMFVFFNDGKGLSSLSPASDTDSNSVIQSDDPLEQLAQLRKDLDDIRKEKQNLEDQISSDVVLPTESDDFVITIPRDVPLVRYARPGLITDEDRANLKKYLLGPYTTYYNELDGGESHDPVISFFITAPVNAGDEFEVDILHKTATVGTLFGFRDTSENWIYWEPACFVECTYPQAFKDKYPELVE